MPGRLRQREQLARVPGDSAVTDPNAVSTLRRRASTLPWTVPRGPAGPLAGGSTVISLSSGAALRGSPLSGAYAGAKPAIRWRTGYAAEESEWGRAGHPVRLAAAAADPATDLGARYVAVYAARQGGPGHPAASGPAAPAADGSRGPATDP
jgi:hypothetical protein